MFDKSRVTNLVAGYDPYGVYTRRKIGNIHIDRVTTDKTLLIFLTHQHIHVVIDICIDHNRLRKHNNSIN